MAQYKILIGADPAAPDFEFSTAQLRSRPQRVSDVDPISSRLSVDELTVRVRHRDAEPYVFAPAGTDGVLTADGYLFGANETQESLQAVPYGTPTWLADASGPIAELYFVETSRLGAALFELRAASAIGFLDRQEHPGGVYNAVPAGTLIQELVGTAFAFSIEAAVGATPVSGWLPWGKARDNLHQLMFALGISIRRDSNDEIVFCYLGGETPEEIPDSRVFLGSKLDYSKPATVVQVTEHSYFATGAEAQEELYNNSASVAADNLIVTFRGPYHSLSATGSLQILRSGANYAVVSGSGTLRGRPYSHFTQLVQRGTAMTADKRSTVSVSDVGLINGLNSQTVADRLYDYYTRRRELTAQLRLEGEKAGDYVRLNGPEGVPVSGYLTRLETAYSTFPRAQAKLVTGYVPGYVGNYFDARQGITVSSSWTVPEGVSGRVRIVLIGGGSGGSGGYDGGTGIGADKMELVREEYTQDDYIYYRSFWHYRSGAQTAAAGGEPGTAGKAGRFLAVDVEVQPGDVLSFSIGHGGDGGTRNGGAGRDGTDTSVIVRGVLYTTRTGSEIPGYVDPLTGERFNLPGEGGHAGAAGGRTDSIDLQGYKGGNGLAGGYFTVPLENGGLGRAVRLADAVTGHTDEYLASGGGGGGGAYGAVGGFGGGGEISGALFVTGGNGGSGANARAPAKPYFGCGGGGGNGGGGGGNGGGCCCDNSQTDWYERLTPGQGGTAGKGSAGGDGGDGAAIIYFRRT